MVGVEQVDAERSPLGHRGGQLGVDFLGGISQRALPQPHAAGRDEQVASRRPEVLGRRRVLFGELELRPRVPALQRRDPGPDVAHADGQIHRSILVLGRGLAAPGPSPVTVGEHDLLGRVVEVGVHQHRAQLLAER